MDYDVTDPGVIGFQPDERPAMTLDEIERAGSADVDDISRDSLQHLYSSALQHAQAASKMRKGLEQIASFHDTRGAYRAIARRTLKKAGKP